MSPRPSFRVNLLKGQAKGSVILVYGKKYVEIK